MKRKSIAVIRFVWVIVMVTVTLTAFTACDGSTTPTGQFIDLDSDGWPYGKVLSFKTPVDSMSRVLPDSTSVIVSVRHSSDYPYANLWLEMSYETADTTAVDTFEMELADEFGKWFGSGTGVSILCSDTVRLSGVRLTDSELRLRHVMRVDTLRGIEQIGVLPVILSE